MAKELAEYVVARKRTAEMLAAVQRSRLYEALPYKVVHLVGTPIETSSELQWQIASGHQTEEAYRLQESRSAALGFAGDLLTADDIPVQSTPLILLQAEPTPTPDARTSFDRQQAGQVRAFAYNLVTAGARAVLTLPPLSLDFTPAVIRSIATAGRRDPAEREPPAERRGGRADGNLGLDPIAHYDVRSP
jgi:hypothetical protein